MQGPSFFRQSTSQGAYVTDLSQIHWSAIASFQAIRVVGRRWILCSTQIIRLQIINFRQSSSQQIPKKRRSCHHIFQQIILITFWNHEEDEFQSIQVSRRVIGQHIVCVLASLRYVFMTVRSRFKCLINKFQREFALYYVQW